MVVKKRTKRRSILNSRLGREGYMARIFDKKHVHCEKKHVGAWEVKWDNGSSTAKCGLLKFVVFLVVHF